MQIPDYQGGSIVNLMATVMAARGGQSRYPNLGLLPPERIADATNLILLVIDGLGADYLAQHSPTGLLSRHLLGPITSVFPSTTAAAIPCFLTGEAPQQHGLTGWFTWLRELGCIMTVLTGNPRYGTGGYRKAGLDPAKLYGLVPVFDRIETRSYVVAPAFIAGSDFNRALCGRARSIPYDGLGNMFRATATILRRDPRPKYLYLYWPKLDTLGHKIGIQAAFSHFADPGSMRLTAAELLEPPAIGSNPVPSLPRLSATSCSSQAGKADSEGEVWTWSLSRPSSTNEPHTRPSSTADDRSPSATDLAESSRREISTPRRAAGTRPKWERAEKRPPMSGNARMTARKPLSTPRTSRLEPGSVIATNREPSPPAISQNERKREMVSRPGRSSHASTQPPRDGSSRGDEARDGLVPIRTWQRTPREQGWTRPSHTRRRR